MTCIFEGLMNFRFVTLDVLAEIEYDRDGYMDIRQMEVWSDRRKQMVPASGRLILRFQEAHWAFLYSECLEHARQMSEYYRDMVREWCH